MSSIRITITIFAFISGFIAGVWDMGKRFKKKTGEDFKY